MSEQALRQCSVVHAGSCCRRCLVLHVNRLQHTPEQRKDVSVTHLFNIPLFRAITFGGTAGIVIVRLGSYSRGEHSTSTISLS
ncbi:hypothetical protein ATANTOWER_017122 [Ataeniobius toweri]|uniref:Uncharacterized protein n=1 Tax=Ataeniobius toweri TaxID=208326 RepID=A0ABU7APY8_9TELE|nr:hypothetical protein [Ataeniobius toweri]